MSMIQPKQQRTIRHDSYVDGWTPYTGGALLYGLR
jgi:hypothetical protein